MASPGARPTTEKFALIWPEGIVTEEGTVIVSGSSTEKCTVSGETLVVDVRVTVMGRASPAAVDAAAGLRISPLFLVTITTEVAA